MKKLVLIGSLFLSAAALAQPVAPPRTSDSMPAHGDVSYVLKVDAPAAKKGERAVAHLKITPGAGFHMNKEYPTSLALSPPDGVTLDKSKLTAKDAAKFDEAQAQFDVAYTAAKPGKQTVTGELKFAVCSANSCDPKKSVVRFEIDVK
jgi:hypothetical protein